MALSRRKEQRNPLSQDNGSSTSAPRRSILSNPSTHQALQLIALAAISSPISWLSMTPVYGSVPSTLYHNIGKTIAASLGFLGAKQLRKIIPLDTIGYLPVLAFWIPTIQFVLFKYSSVLGATYGPVVTELLTYYPLTLISLYAAGTFLEEVDFSGLGGAIAEHGPAVGTYFAFTTIERMAQSVVVRNVGSNVFVSRIGLQLMVAITYALAIPGAVLWAAIPSVAFTLTYNVHNPLQRTTDVLNATLQLQNFTLVDRRESVTGYISVLDNHAARYRVLRCDHSLLGGEWKMPQKKGQQPPRAQEPIYAIFAMLEAVRLVETDDGQPRRPDAQSNALNIGLGIGTAPGALIAHGVNTTIVELDPVVYRFAVQYFNLPTNHTPIIADAVHLVQDAQSRNLTTRYDYIIHDVFTGGAEPVELFTQEFLSGLKYLLKEDGVVAINYAGDLSLPASYHVLATIRSVFPVCRIFRETLPPSPEPRPQSQSQSQSQPQSSSSATSSATKDEDFTNMLIFCKHPNSPSTSLTFRKPTRADFLGSGARQQYLFPRAELEIPWGNLGDGRGQVLRKGQTGQVEQWHRKSAVGHWGIMRSVLPDGVWENW